MLKLGLALNRTQKRITTASNFDVNAAAFIAVAGITNPNQQNAINDLCIGLKNAGLFTKILALYPFVGGNASAHSYNLINTANYQLTFNGGWVHNSQGATSNGVNGYANTGFNPNANLTFNSNHLSFYNNVAAGQVSFAGYNLGSSEATGLVDEIALIVKYNNTQAYYSADGGYNCTYTPIPANNRGFSQGTMNSTSTQVYYFNGNSVASAVSAGSAFTTKSIYIGAFNQNNVAVQFSDYTAALVSIGSGFSAAEASTFYTLVQNYETTLLRQV